LRPAENTVIVLSDSGRNDAINGVMRALSVVLEQQSLDVDYFDVGICTGDDWQRAINLLSSGIVKFAVTYLGIGQDLSIEVKASAESRNAWEAFNVPLIKIHGDLPAYFLQRHSDYPSTSINLYASEDYLEFHRWALPDARCISAVFEPYLISDTPRQSIDFRRRANGKLVFLKTGGNPEALASLWQQKLPDSICEQLLELKNEMMAVALKPGRFSVLQFVLDYLSSRRIDSRGLAAIVRLYVAQLDDYLRRAKATLVGKALLGFPVVIQGSGWDHLDFSGAKAQLVAPANFQSTETIFQNELGIVDMSPNVDTSVHDRMWRAAGTYAFALTNKSSWLENLLPELNAYAYEFDEDSIRTSVDRVLRHPAECVALAERYGNIFRERYKPEAVVDRLITLADMARLQGAAQKPPLQPYFVW
jgi:hypothetical protein